jgi:hypothetical protein
MIKKVGTAITTLKKMEKRKQADAEEPDELDELEERPKKKRRTVKKLEEWSGLDHLYTLFKEQPTEYDDSAEDTLILDEETKCSLQSLFNVLDPTIDEIERLENCRDSAAAYITMLFNFSRYI